MCGVKQCRGRQLGPCRLVPAAATRLRATAGPDGASTPPPPSPPPADFADTWAALDRRLEGAWALGAAAGDAGSLAGVVGAAAGSLAQQLGGLLRRPPL